MTIDFVLDDWHIVHGATTEYPGKNDWVTGAGPTRYRAEQCAGERGVEYHKKHLTLDQA